MFGVDSTSGHVLHDRITPIGALSINKRLSGGSQAPTLSVSSLSGEAITIGGPAGSSHAHKNQLLVFVSPDCPVCKELLPVLKSIRQQEFEWLSVLLASDGGEIATHQAFVRRQGLHMFPYVLSEKLGVAFGVSRLPYAVLIDEQGTISALGLVNSREQLESLFESKRLKRPTIQDYLSRETHEHIG